MSTKTFDVFISDQGLNNLKESSSATAYAVKQSCGGYKAKLIVETPERSGTISESEFDNALTAADCIVQVIRDKVFGKDTQ